MAWQVYRRYRNERGDKRWVKASRWVIRGSRLLSPISVAHVLGGILRARLKRAKAAPLQISLRSLRAFAACRP